MNIKQLKDAISIMPDDLRVVVVVADIDNMFISNDVAECRSDDEKFYIVPKFVRERALPLERN